MALSVDPQTFVITVPKADTTLIQASPTEIRELNLNTFRLALKAWEDDGINGGITFTKTHAHNTEVLLGGITYARVIEILEPYTITFEDGAYAVNLIGANSNVGDRVNVNQVSIRSANSAGLISNQAIEFSSFNGGVTVDIANKTTFAKAGTLFPIGTRQNPSNNLADAYIIAMSRGFSKIFIIGNLTLTNTTNWTGFEFQGESPLKTVITVEAAANVVDCEFYDATLSGVLDGNSYVTNSVITNLDFIDGFIYKCAIGPADIKLGLSTAANIFSCYSTVPGLGTPEIDMNGTGILALRDYHGGILLKNYSGTDSHSIDLSSGQVKLDPTTITNGTFIFRGVGKLVDATTNEPIKTGPWNTNVTIINELINLTNISEAAVYTSAIYIDAINGRAGTTDPIGLERDPVNNLADAITLAVNRGTSKLIFLSDYTFQNTDSITGYNIYGKGAQYTTLTFVAGAICAFCDFHDCTMTGSIAGVTGMTDCHLINLGSVGLVPSSQDLVVKNCKFSGTTTLPSNYSGNVTLLNCYSDNSAIVYPVFNAGNYTGNFLMDNWSGQVELKNVTQGNLVDLRISQGEVELEIASVTNAIVHVTGTGFLSDNLGEEIVSGIWNGGVTVENETVNTATIADRVWDELLTGNTHNIQNTAGKRLRDLASATVHTDTARGPAVNGNQIELALAASTLDGAYDPSMITIIDGTGVGQTRLIVEYNGTNRIATVDRDWKVNPDATSEYVISAHPGREHVNEGLARGGTINTITLNALASSVDDAYIHQTVFIRSGTGSDQIGMVVAYNGTTKVVTVEEPWSTIPDTTSGYAMLPMGTSVWTELEKDTALAYSKKASDNAEQANLKL